jgi:transcriptional regulator GlxA family with amidase domain
MTSVCTGAFVYADAGLLTAAGVSAGIDMALHLVGRLGSPDKAREVRRYIQYDPAPRTSSPARAIARVRRW